MTFDDAHLMELARLLDAGVPFDAIAFYGRWWQLERWLRDMVYLELRAKYGSGWLSLLGRSAARRAEIDVTNSYMASADSNEVMAYVDVSILFEIIAENWPLFEPFLPRRTRWEGLVDVLGDLRNRNAHCRRPHRDDLSRIEQALRDLEDGAWSFYASFATTASVTRNSKDPMAKQWGLGKHETARRLLKHAELQYDTSFALRYTVRPWAAPPGVNRISGSEGAVWKAHWIVRGGELRPAELWERIRGYNDTAELLIYLELTSFSVTASFSALDDMGSVANAIGAVFDCILETGDFHGGRVATIDEAVNRWRRSIESLPARVQAENAFTLTDPYNRHAFKLFRVD